MRRRMMKILYGIAALVCSCVGVVALMLSGGCMTPDIADKEWTYLRVTYMERDENDKLKPQSWHSEDREFLERLRAAFPRGGEYVPCHKPGGSKLHRVDVRVRKGQWWSLTYVTRYQSAPAILCYDESQKNPLYFYYAFYFEHSNPEAFFTTLTNEIMNVSGTAVDLNTKVHRGELDELKDNNAAWHDRRFPRK